MNLKLKRIDPFWMVHPMILTGVVAGIVIVAVGFQMQLAVLEAIGALVAGVSIFLAAKPAVSAVLALLGIIAGIASNFFSLSPGSLGMSVPLRLVSTLVFSLTYMVLMDAAVLVVAALYNFFASVGGLGGVSLEFEESSDQGIGA